MTTMSSLFLHLNNTTSSSIDCCSFNHSLEKFEQNHSLFCKKINFVNANYRSSLFSSKNWFSGFSNLEKSFSSYKNGYGKKTIKTMSYAGVGEELDLNGERIAEDYYSILGLTPDATPDEIKKAYYSCMKACHPDLNKNNPENVEFCMFVNEVYEVLSDPDMRAVYDEINGYTLTGLNPFRNSNQVLDHCFVDEFTCIGCKNCANTAENTFDIEPLYGRARVMSQNSDSVPLVQEAIDTCPVNCIHWVSAAQLTLLEDEMRRIERVNVAVMLGNMGSRGMDVFEQAAWRWDKRQAQAVERARVKLATELKNKAKVWWNDSFGSDASDSEASSSSVDAAKMARAAAAARRWREYSRSGVDRKATRAISDMVSMKMEENEKEEVKEKEKENEVEEKAVASR